MTRNLTFALVAAAALAGCNSQSASEAEANAAAANAATAAPVELPPSIAHSKIYRCKDNSVVYIDWLSDNKTANLRSEKNGAATQLVAPEAGQPMVAEGGFSLTGTADDASITLARPGIPSESCKA